MPAQTFQELLKDMWFFFKNPQPQPEAWKSKSQAFKEMGQILLIDYALMLLSTIPLLLFLNKEIMDSHKMDEVLKEFPPLMIFFYGALLAPVMEEIAFRLYLRFSPLNLMISFLLLSLFFGTMLPTSLLYHPVFMVVALLLVLSFLFLFRKRIAQSLEHFWRKQWAYIYYFSALLFGFFHLSNYELPVYQLILLSPILVLPQILLGFILGYLRIKRGILAPICLHILHNTGLLIPFLLYESKLLEGG
ncbi:MAG: CPBP family intramembrane glutamic endopeptidase [Bacteroidota bacterium]